ncbi:succinate dehydrogenase [ubiquinone] cytochrome b small subunit, mitochondrial-like [Gigantopelta aegis]|uniref:succinate dehydrogenase [ubiquinone] cytochrome b small subunit, mitochondrial-like n=1 Tax=Gigantopelta aegis TaxID=1735272 RepID=UPI001B88790D|nr:succinate dehydrogenase [ubiquinone] cytochrome b small subunit, mitochondrial-like [Gigantopelta aegis]
MATVSILRACSRGSRCLLYQFQYGISKQAIATNTPAMSSSVPEFLRARRGPFTPKEKRAGGHLMMASTHWKVERIVMLSMIPIMPGAILFAGPIMDYALSTVVFLHGFWGIEGVLSDYLMKFVPWVQYVWYGISILAFAGLIHFNYSDVGVTQAIKMLWSL